MTSPFLAGAVLPAADLAGIKDSQVAFTPTWTGTGFNKGSSTLSGAYWDMGNQRRVVIHAAITIGGAWAEGTSVWSFGGFGAFVDPAGVGSTRLIPGGWNFLDSPGGRCEGDILRVSSTTVQCIMRAYGTNGQAITPARIIGGTTTANRPTTAGAAYATGDTLTLDFLVPIL